MVDLTALAEAVPPAARRAPARKEGAKKAVPAQAAKKGSWACGEASQGDGEIARARRGGAAGGAVAGIDSPHRGAGASGLLGGRPCS